jgi:hypothetical protein
MAATPQPGDQTVGPHHLNPSGSAPPSPHTSTVHGQHGPDSHPEAILHHGRLPSDRAGVQLAIPEVHPTKSHSDRRPGGLGVDDPHPARPDGQVVDVGPATGHHQIVTDDPAAAIERVQQVRGRSLGRCSPQPPPGVRRASPPNADGPGDQHHPGQPGPSGSRGPHGRPGSDPGHPNRSPTPGRCPGGPVAGLGRPSSAGTHAGEDKRHRWYSSHLSGLLTP